MTVMIDGDEENVSLSIAAQTPASTPSTPANQTAIASNQAPDSKSTNPTTSSPATSPATPASDTPAVVSPSAPILGVASDDSLTKHRMEVKQNLKREIFSLLDQLDKVIPGP